MPTNKETPELSRQAGKVLGALALLAAMLWLVMVGNISWKVTVEAGSGRVDAADFEIFDLGASARFLEEPGVDTGVPGTYPVTIRYLGRTYERKVEVKDTAAPEAVVTDLTAAMLPEAADFCLEIRDATRVTVSYLEAPDMSKLGTQRVRLVLTDEGGNTAAAEAVLTVVPDEAAPELQGVADLTVYLGREPEYLAGVTVADDWDPEPEVTVDDSRVDLSREGEYKIVYTAVDAAGNKASESAFLTIIKDDTAPNILGVQNISLYVGSTVSYRSGVLVTDDVDESPKLSIDSSGVDLSKPGTYEVVYTAADGAGNVSSITVTVTVEERPDTCVSEEEIYAAADAVLEKILKDGMTDREKVYAVYLWLYNNFKYSGLSGGTDWLQAAYSMMESGKGNCFGYYALSRLMFDRLGYPNLTVTRIPNEYRDTNHYWNMVSLDGGETYYHFDATPRQSVIDGKWHFCLVTDAYLDRYDRASPGYYTRDRELYPATPEE